MTNLTKNMYLIICALSAAILIGTFGFAAAHPTAMHLDDIAMSDIAPAH